MSSDKPMAPGARFTEVAPRPRPKKKAPPPGPNLEEEIHEALELACHGQPMSPHLIGSMKLACLTVLSRRGLRGKISIRQQGSGFVVDLQLPPAVPRIERIQINVGGNRWDRR